MNSDKESALPVIEDPNNSLVTEDNEQGFDMTIWAQTCRINRKTTDILCKDDIVSKDTLILLTKKDLIELGLPLGQRKLVVAAIGPSSSRSLTITWLTPHRYMTGLGSISGRPYWILTFSIENVRLNMVLYGVHLRAIWSYNYSEKI